MKCAICGKNADCETVYILPLTFIEDCNYDKSNIRSEIIPLMGEPTEYGYQNALSLCSACTPSYPNKIILPSPKNVALHLRRYNADIIRGYISFVYSYRVPIYLYLSERCLSYDKDKDMFLTNMMCMVLIRDLKEVIEYVEKGVLRI